MKPRNMCAMSEACEGKCADHGLMCADCRAEDAEIEAMLMLRCDCPPCRSDLAGVVPCDRRDSDHEQG